MRVLDIWILLSLFVEVLLKSLSFLKLDSIYFLPWRLSAINF